MNSRNDAETRLAACIRNDNYPTSLEVGRLYQVLPDADAAAHHLARVIDESGEDYLYQEDYFTFHELPDAYPQK